VSLDQPTHRHHPDNRQDPIRFKNLLREVESSTAWPSSAHLLLRVVQSSDRYQVLCVTRQSARVFEGNRDALDELEAGTFPPDIEIALGEERTEPHQTERYFRAVDRATIAQFSTPSELPLVLAALPEHQPVFRRLSQNAALLERGVDGDPRCCGQTRRTGRPRRSGGGGPRTVECPVAG